MARLLGAWRSSGPAYASLARALRLLVLDGRLPLRTRLPGERELAEALGVSRTTTAGAYAALRDEGFLASRRGSGSWTQLPADAGAAPVAGPSGEDVIDLSCAACAAPEGALHSALVAASAELPRHLPGPGYDAAGLVSLRRALAEQFTRRGVPTTPDQIFVTAGALHAFTLLLRVLAGPGDRVLTEHPTYAAALDAVRAVGARPVPVPMLADGWDLDMLEATLRQAAPRLAYVIPDHQNPTGLTMSAEDRSRLVALTRASRTPLVVDETIAGLELDGQPGELPVAALDVDGETAITIGSMSKAYWAGMRIGWIRATPALVRRLSAARAALDICSPVLEQLVAVELLAREDEVLARQRAAARERRDTFVRALRSQLPEWRVRVPAGGLSLWVELDAPRSTALAAIADRHGVRLAAGPRFGVDGAFERFVRLPFSLPSPVLEDAASRLAVAWRAVSDSAPLPLDPPAALVA
ncbi:MocR-like transcription factor YczR [Solirubrobacter soli]|uniref:MocR-like transcription factor YczR n=1 Tax=Solirubrobacter soli TaxID=363832 RepID=UPI001B7FD209|nr:PLP-dependent aminotransferase family protein [Solirubrobacter soli]